MKSKSALVQTAVLGLVLLCQTVQAVAENEFFASDVDLDDAEGRFLNSTTDTSTTLILSTVLVWGMVILVTIFSTFSLRSASRRNVVAYEGHQPYQQYRSNDESAMALDTSSILKWIQILTEMYQEFDINDMDCQKKYFCEMLKNPKLFHTQPVAKGMEYAKYLEVIALPDEVRGLLDEFLDAFEVSKGRKECTEYFYCPYSFMESYKRTFLGNEVN